MWHRFQQLGCNSAGFIPKDSIKESVKLKDNVFLKNLLITIAIDDNIYFHSFLNFVKWAEGASIEEKCRAIYSFFNQGSPIGTELFSRILKRAHPDEDDATIAKYTDIVFQQTSSQGKGGLNFYDFMRICSKLPEDQLSHLLHFTIIPDKISEEAAAEFDSSWLYLRDVKLTEDDVLVCKMSYEELANAISQSDDYTTVAKALGFTDKQITSITSKHSTKRNQVLSLLKYWEDLQADEATCGALRDVLKKAERDDLFDLVYGIQASETPS